MLAPTKFPGTASDIDFISKLELKNEDYDRYAELTPYEQMILEKADEEIERQIAEDLARFNQSGETDAESQETNDFDANIEDQIVEDFNDGDKNNGYEYKDDTNSTAKYCQVTQPKIPEKQTIPFGSPVLHDDFIYCAPYGNVNRGMGYRKHTGYDIGCTLASFNKPVFATADGVVKIIQPNRQNKSAGNYIIIDHGNGFLTWYLHLNKILVTTGQRVSAGCQIATIGNTGGSLESIKKDKSYRPHFSKKMSHLHYEIRYTGNKTSVTATNGNSVKIQHAWSDNESIDPTHFICIYDNFKYGHCRDTFPYTK